MWVKVRIGNHCRCKSGDCNATLHRSAEVYLADDGTVLCVPCHDKRHDRDHGAEDPCIVCNDDWARTGRLTCSRKCEYRLRRQNRLEARTQEIIEDART
jgi:hypothetical protein